MTSTIQRPGPGSEPKIIRGDDVKVLGTAPGRGQFVAHRGTEYELSSHDINPAGMSHRATFIVVSKFITDDHGGRIPSPSGAEYRLATPVPAGTYQQLMASQASQALDAMRYSRVDALGAVWSRTGRGVDAALRYLEKRGVLFGADGDRLEAYQQKGKGAHLHDVIRLLLTTGHDLVLGYLSAKSPACELKHGKDDAAPALSVTLGGMLVCEQHLDEDVATEARAKARAA